MSEEASQDSLDSLSSSTASDVLIRSTSIHRTRSQVAKWPHRDMPGVQSGGPHRDMTGVQSGGPHRDMPGVQSGGPHRDMTGVQSGGPHRDMPGVQSGGPHRDMPGVQSGGPHRDMTGVQSGGPYRDMKGVQSGGLHRDMTGVQSGGPHRDMTGVQSGGPYRDMTGVQSGGPQMDMPGLQSGGTHRDMPVVQSGGPYRDMPEGPYRNMTWGQHGGPYWDMTGGQHWRPQRDMPGFHSGGPQRYIPGVHSGGPHRDMTGGQPGRPQLDMPGDQPGGLHQDMLGEPQQDMPGVQPGGPQLDMPVGQPGEPPGVQSRGPHRDTPVSQTVWTQRDKTKDQESSTRVPSQRTGGSVSVPDTQRKSGQPESSVEKSEEGVTKWSMRKTHSVECSTVPCVSSESSRVHLSVQRLHDFPTPLPQFAWKKQEASYTPPALPAIKSPAVLVTSMNGKAGVTRDDTLGEVQRMSASTKEPSAPKAYVTRHPREDEGGFLKKMQDCSNKTTDVQIAHYAAGQKEAMLAALNQRAQRAPVTKPAPVKLLEDTGAQRKETPPPGGTQSHAVYDPVTTVAAATAAAIAATAPLLKAQNNMEAPVSSVSQLLDKLHEADRQLQRITEQQSKLQYQPAERVHHQDRVGELERQLAQLTEQRLQHLEKLQQQQMEMQSHFISSAIKASTCQHGATVPVCTHRPSAVPKHLPQSNPVITSPPSHGEKGEAVDVTSHTGKSPLETPTPRRFAPVPMSKDVQVPQKISFGKENMEEHKIPVNLGKGMLLQQILGHDGSSYCRSTNKDCSPVNLTKPYRRPYNDSFSLFPMDRTGTERLSQRTNPCTSAAVQKASDVLHDLGQLKQEMHSMLQEAAQWKAPVNDYKPREQFVSSYLSRVPQKPEPSIRGTVKPPKSMFEDAERILREVQNNKKVLEDNLEAIIRAKDGAAVYSLVNALTTNSNAAEQIRIRKAVDSWITEISCEIQDEMTKKSCDNRAQELSLRRKAETARDVRDKRGANSKALKNTSSANSKPAASAKPHPPLSEQTLPGPTRTAEVAAQPLLRNQARSKVLQSDSALPDNALDKLYGKPVYQGHRSTLKKGPYLRFSSPSPRSKAQRPRVLETVRGTKLKSAKTQTGSTQSDVAPSKPAPQELCAPILHEPQYVFSPSGEATGPSAPLQGHLIPMAIPLGRSQVDGVSPRPASVILTRPQAVTVNVSVPSSPPKPTAKSIKPNIAVIEVVSEKKEPPQLSVQVMPCVDIDSITSDCTEISLRAPSPEEAAPSILPVAPDIQLPGTAESEQEVLAFPGSSFVQVTDITQDEEDEIPEPLLELNGWTDTVTPQYHGIAFPPPAPAPQTTTDILDGIITRRETLENRLISWVEQEIMSRIISEMHPPRQEAVPDISVSSSDSSVTAASDIVETTGGEGFQLFVDAGVPVDSSLIRHYVDEALAETIAIMLGERESQKAQPPSSSKPAIQVPEIPPVPTPECTPPASPLPTVTELPTVKTPELSPQASVTEPECEAGLPEDAGMKFPASPVTTPVRTPLASPPRVATPTPPISEEPEDRQDTQSRDSPHPWGSAELPLDEENPFSSKEAIIYKDASVMTVAKDEEPESLASAPSPKPEKSYVPRPNAPKAPSPVPSLSSGPSTQESSLTVTVTETDTDRPISEGELLYSYGQIVAARAIAEEGLPFLHLTESLSSTLRDANEMEYDPPSEGEVVPVPHSAAHRDPVLNFLATYRQDPVASNQIFHHAENSEEEHSVGEISEGQRPRISIAAEQVLVGHSGIQRRLTNGGYHSRRASSPGQCSRIPGPSHEDSDISPGPMSIRELESQPMHHFQDNNPAWLPGPAHSTSQGPAPAPTRFIQVGVKSEDPQQGAPEDLDRTVVEPNVYLQPPLSASALQCSAMGVSWAGRVCGILGVILCTALVGFHLLLRERPPCIICEGNVSEPLRKLPVTVPSMDEADHEEEIKEASFASDSSGADTF